MGAGQRPLSISSLCVTTICCRVRKLDVINVDHLVLEGKFKNSDKFLRINNESCWDVEIKGSGEGGFLFWNFAQVQKPAFVVHLVTWFSLKFYLWIQMEGKINQEDASPYLFPYQSFSRSVSSSPRRLDQITPLWSLQKILWSSKQNLNCQLRLQDWLCGELLADTNHSTQLWERSISNL